MIENTGQNISMKKTKYIFLIAFFCLLFIPVRHAAGLTIGFGGDGGTIGYYINDYNVGSAFSTAGAGAEIATKVSARLKSSSNKNAKIAIYNTSNALIDTTAEVLINNASFAWFDFNITSGHTAPTTAMYMLMDAATGSSTTYCCYDADAAIKWFYGTRTYTTFPVNPSGFNYAAAATGRKHSIYATYTAESPPATTTEDPPIIMIED